MHAVIAPASVASICAVGELPRTGDCSFGIDAVTGVSIGAGAITRIWLVDGASNRSVCTSVLAAGGVLSTAVGSALLPWSDAAIFAA